MATMSKSFLFYLKNWDVMEDVLYATDEEIENIEISEEQNEMINDVGNAANDYAMTFLDKIGENVSVSKKDLFEAKLIGQRGSTSWFRRYYIWKKGTPASMIKAKNAKHLWGVGISNYNNSLSIGLFLWISKKENLNKAAKIFGDLNTLHTDKDVIFPLIINLPEITDFRINLHEEPIIQEFVNKAEEVFTKEKMDAFFSIPI